MTPLHGSRGKFLLFAYGTLKQGGIRHPALKKERFLGEAKTLPHYALFDLGAYPGLARCPEGGQEVHGELYEVDCAIVDWLDGMEGAPTLFKLEPIDLAGTHGEAWSYFYQRDATECPRLPSGLWHNRAREAAMATEQAFLDTILDDPADEVSRLVFADWLEERGGPGDADRAEFIRLQCRLQHPSEDAEALRVRARELLDWHWRDWVRPAARALDLTHEYILPTCYGPKGGLENFEGGFLSAAEINAGVFVRGAQKLFRVAPIARLYLKGAGKAMAELAACRQLANVTTFAFIDFWRDPVAADGMALLAACRYLTRLRRLSLNRNNIGDEGAGHLAKAEWLCNLEDLDLTDNGLSALGARALANAPKPFLPRRLLLSRNPIGNEGLAALADSKVLSKTTTLELTDCNIGPEGAGALARSPHVQGLLRLDLTGNALYREGAWRLMQAPWFGRLRTLRLAEAHVPETMRTELEQACPKVELVARP